MGVFGCWKGRSSRRKSKTQREERDVGAISNGLRSEQAEKADRTIVNELLHEEILAEEQRTSTRTRTEQEPHRKMFALLRKKNRNESPDRDKKGKRWQPMEQAPPKKVSFSWRNTECREYEYIDAEGVDEEAREDENADGTSSAYCRLDENQSLHSRYDYPAFSKRDRMRRAADEPLYYSMGSEDPYSSIVSIGDRPVSGGGDSSSTYEPGYSHIRNNNVAERGNRDAEFDSLYAKIHRKHSLNAQPSTSGIQINGAREKGEQQNNGFRLEMQQQGESGSGSVTSGSQPSYRYLTVRESVDVVRERIRQREQATLAENDENNEGTGGADEAREHYYSTIGGGNDEYETVGDSVYGGSSSLWRAARSSASNSNRFSLNGSLGDNGVAILGSTEPAPLSPPPLNGGTLRVLLSPSEEPPRPPTSPIPSGAPPIQQQQPRPPPPLIRRPVVLSVTAKRLKQLPNFLLHGATSSNGTTHGERVALKSILNGTVENGTTERAKTDGQTLAVNSHSRIPVPVPKNGALRSRTPSPTLSNATTQTGGERGHRSATPKRGTTPTPRTAAPLPKQVGKDYVSPIGMGSARGWPLTSPASSFDERDDA